MKITFNKNGIKKQVKYGVSWTVFFFGWMALAMRKQYLAAFISFITFGMANFYFMFASNKMMAHSLMENGWKPRQALPEPWTFS